MRRTALYSAKRVAVSQRFTTRRWRSSTNIIVGAPRSGVFRTTFKLGVLLGTGYVFARVYHCAHSRSLIYLGESLDYERELDESLGIPLSKVIPRVAQGIIFSFLRRVAPESVKSVVDPAIAYEALSEEQPRLFLGPLLLARQALLEGRVDDAREHYARAKRLALLTEPEYNKPMMSFFQTEEELFENKDDERTWKVKLAERVPGKIWTVDGPFKAPTGLIDVQAGIIRLENGNIIIYNPIPMDDEIIAEINKLGKVVALVSSSPAHGGGIASLSSKFPEAQVWGMDTKRKHGHPEVKWTGFIEDEQIFGAEFKHIQLKGHMGELIFFHPDSKTLFMTDFSLPTHPKAISLKLYDLALGVWRGDKSLPLGGQSYHVLFTRNPDLLRDSLKEILASDAERIVLGHGGVIEGKELVRKCLTQAFKFVLSKKSEEEIGFIERSFLPLAWAAKMHLIWPATRLALAYIPQYFENSKANKEEGKK